MKKCALQYLCVLLMQCFRFKHLWQTFLTFGCYIHSDYRKFQKQSILPRYCLPLFVHAFQDERWSRGDSEQVALHHAMTTRGMQWFHTRVHDEWPPLTPPLQLLKISRSPSQKERLINNSYTDECKRSLQLIYSDSSIWMAIFICKGS